jgi:hypothetical protein
MNLKKSYILDYLKLVIPAIIVFGMIKLSVFYSAFNINIFVFLDFDEILTSSLNDVIFVSLFLILGAFQGIALLEENDQNKKNKFDEKYMENKSPKRFVNYILHAWETPPIIFLIVVILISHFIKKYSYLLSSFKLVVYIMVAFFLLDFFILEFERHFRNKISKEAPRYIFGFLYLIGFMLILSGSLASLEVHYVKHFKYYKNVKFKINSEMIKSDENQYYIGKTRNYIFYYLEKTSETIVYPMKNVEALYYSKNPETH